MGCWLLQNLSTRSRINGTRIQKVESECVLDIGMDLWSKDKEMVRPSSVTLLTHSTQACNIFQSHSVLSHWILCILLADIPGGHVSTDETKPRQ